MTERDIDAGDAESNHVRVRFELPRDANGWRPATSETLWALPTAIPRQYRLDNVPFFAPDVSLGDVVYAEVRADALEFVAVVEKSGHRTVGLRYYSDGTKSSVRAALVDMGCSVERGDDPKVLAVDIPPTASLEEVRAYLLGLEERGELTYYENDVPAGSGARRPVRPPSALPFSEPPDLGVFVSRAVMDGSPVRVVDHDRDGDWVFLTGEEPSDEAGHVPDADLMLVCLHDVVSAHPEVHAIAGLPVGHSAEYLDDERGWGREAIEPDTRKRTP